MALYTVDRIRNSITVFGIEYVAQFDKDVGKYRKYNKKIYGTRAEIFFDSSKEFFEKVWERIPDDIKIENGAIESRVQTLENTVHNMNNSINKRFELQDNKIVSVETKVDSHTEELEILRKLVLKHELTISEQSAKIISLEENDKIQDRKIVTLETRVSELESENKLQNLEIRKISKYHDEEHKEEISAQKRRRMRETNQLSPRIEQLEKDVRIVERSVVVYDEAKICSLETNLWRKEAEIIELKDRLDRYEAKADKYCTEDDYDVLSTKVEIVSNNTNNLSKYVNTNIEKTNKNINILDKRSLSNKEKIVNIDKRSNINASNINILDDRTLHQGTEIESVKVDMFLTREQRLRKHRN